MLGILSGFLSEVGSASKYVEAGEIQKCVWNNPLVILQEELYMPCSRCSWSMTLDFLGFIPKYWDFRQKNNLLVNSRKGGGSHVYSWSDWTRFFNGKIFFKNQ
jgi:hypothetical protein